jgi:hypothetical protein
MFDFEYLEPRQGFNVELLVTGKTTDEPIPTGTIIGLPNGFRKFDVNNRRTIANIFIILSSIGVIGGSVVLKVFGFSDNTNTNGAVIWLPALFFTFIVAGTLWPQGISRRQGIPSDLRT